MAICRQQDAFAANPFSSSTAKVPNLLHTQTEKRNK